MSIPRALLAKRLLGEPEAAAQRPHEPPYQPPRGDGGVREHSSPPRPPDFGRAFRAMVEAHVERKHSGRW